MEDQMKGTMLEPSTNTHHLSGEVVDKKEYDDPVGTMQLRVEGEGLVTHGEHGTLKTESRNLFKFNQQEYNPYRERMQAAYD